MERLATLLVLLVAQVAAAQPKLHTVFHDGSTLYGYPQQAEILFDTPYGRLTIPVHDIRHMLCGCKLSKAEQGHLHSLVKDLSDDRFPTRAAAVTALQALPPRYLPHMQAVLVKLDDGEVKQRLAPVLHLLSGRSAGWRDKATDDEVITAHGTFRGVLTQEELVLVTEVVGKVSVATTQLRSLAIRMAAKEATIDAARHSDENWLDTGVTVLAGQILTVSADGKVDLWPMGPGQYMVGPGGGTATGKGGRFMMGALIGRIGPTGEPFYIGAQHHQKTTAAGQLYLHVVGSPWNNASAGRYKATIVVD